MPIAKELPGTGVCRTLSTLFALAVLPAAAAVAADDETIPTRATGWEFGIEVKGDYRDSEYLATPVPFPFSPSMLPLGQTEGLMETVDAGGHTELSTFTLRLARRWQRGEFFVKVDFEQLHDRNPTSTGEEIDIDELWVRFGRETPPALLAEGFGGYVKLGKFPAFERQDDRHLESYGLVSTAFNRQEDVGAEAGVDLGPYLYAKVSYTQGNPVFLRDPNALAGDNGTPEFTQPNPDPRYRSGITIHYDADVRDVDFEQPELGAGIGLRVANLDGSRGADLLFWGRERDLADTTEFHGSFYGGDLDLLLGPANLFPYPVTGVKKEETGANLWVYLGGFTLFGQYVDQDLAGLPRTGIEGEAAWTINLPLRWSVGGGQLFPYIAPAVRYSKLDPDFEIPLVTPAPSFGWDWEKWDLGIRLGIARGLDVTIEVADNEFVLRSGATRKYSETLVTVRYRLDLPR